MNARRNLIAASTVCWAFVAGAGFAAEDRSDQPVADSWITTKVKAELAKDEVTKARNIDVDTKNGIVTLSGTVDSTAEKQKAEQNARSVKGVKDVTSDLAVSPRQ